jgi:hypothetical protein
MWQTVCAPAGIGTSPLDLSPHCIHSPHSRCTWRGHHREDPRSHLKTQNCGPKPSPEQYVIYNIDIFLDWILNDNKSVKVARSLFALFPKGPDDRGVGGSSGPPRLLGHRKPRCAQGMSAVHPPLHPPHHTPSMRVRHWTRGNRILYTDERVERVRHLIKSWVHVDFREGTVGMITVLGSGRRKVKTSLTNIGLITQNRKIV